MLQKLKEAQIHQNSMRHFQPFLSLFTSVGTLFCCAIPALFVLLGAGASFASLTNKFSSINLDWNVQRMGLFVLGGIFLTWVLCYPLSTRLQSYVI